MLAACFTYLKARFGSRKGQGMVEYGLIIGLVVVIIIAAFTFLNQPLRDLFNNIGQILTNAKPDPTKAPT